MKEICNFPKLWAPLYLTLALSLIWTLRIRQIPHFFSLKYSIMYMSVALPARCGKVYFNLIDGGRGGVDCGKIQKI